MTPLILMVGTDKGGTGKTTVARVLDDYLQVKHANYRAFDCEPPHGGLARFAPAARIIDIANVDDQMAVFDDLRGVVLLDLRATALSPTLKALAKVGLLDAVRAKRANLALLQVIGPSMQSLREIDETAATLGAGVAHCLVKNYASTAGYAEWEKDPRFAEVLKIAAPRTVTIGHLEDRAFVAVEQRGGSFGGFAADPKSSFMLAGYVRAWLASAFAEFDRVGLAGLVAAAI